MVLAAEKAFFGEHFIISVGELSIDEIFHILDDAAGVKAPATLGPNFLFRDDFGTGSV